MSFIMWCFWILSKALKGVMPSLLLLEYVVFVAQGILYSLHSVSPYILESLCGAHRCGDN